VLFVLMRMTSRAIQRDPFRQPSDILRKLTYWTMVVSSFVPLGVFSTVVCNFLGDALTARFVLKALSAGLMSTGVFGGIVNLVANGQTNALRSPVDQPAATTFQVTKELFRSIL
jgi:hypothetical protein